MLNWKMESGLLVLVGLLLSADLRAQNPEPGRWRVDRVKLSVTAESWGPSCGAKPKSHGWRVSPDEFELTSKGGELYFKSKRRSFSTVGCEGKSKKLKKFNHSVNPGSWATECVAPDINGTPEERSRHSFQLLDGQHLLYVTEGSRLMVPKGAPKEELPLGQARGGQVVWYSDGTQWKQGTRMEALAASKCQMVFKREEKLEKMPDPTGGCTSAGPARRLKFKPETADLAPLGKVCFQLQAFDVDDCPTALPKVSYILDPEGLASVDGQGCVTAPAEIASQVAVALTAKSITQRASALLRLIPSEKEEKTDMETLAQQSQSPRVKQVVAEVIGSVKVDDLKIQPSPSSTAQHQSSPAVAHSTVAKVEEKTFPLWLLLVAIGGLGLVVIVLVALKKKKQPPPCSPLEKEETPPKEPSEAPMAKPVELPTKGAMVCPKCKFEFESGTFCPFDREKLLPLDHDARHTLFIPLTGGMLCPVCGTRYPSKARFCGKDRSPLVPDLEGK